MFEEINSESDQKSFKCICMSFCRDCKCAQSFRLDARCVVNYTTAGSIALCTEAKPRVSAKSNQLKHLVKASQSDTQQRRLA
eukprot:2456685-Amphidinium_carterae.1